MSAKGFSSGCVSACWRGGWGGLDDKAGPKTDVCHRCFCGLVIFSAVHGVLRRPDGLLFASSDSRKHGVPDAY